MQTKEHTITLTCLMRLHSKLNPVYQLQLDFLKTKPRKKIINNNLGKLCSALVGFKPMDLLTRSSCTCWVIKYVCNYHHSLLRALLLAYTLSIINQRGVIGVKNYFQPLSPLVMSRWIKCCKKGHLKARWKEQVCIILFLVIIVLD